LHWFDTEKFFEIIKNDLLAKEGVFAVLGYYCRGFEFNLLGKKGFAEKGKNLFIININKVLTITTNITT